MTAATPAMRGRDVALMLLCTLLWSTAGVVTRHLDEARGFEITFWRSLFAAAGMLVVLPLAIGWRRVVNAFACGGRLLWASGLCWATMMTAFMLALTMTRVAVVLVISAVGPLATALFGRIFLRQKLAWSTWLAIIVAGLGVAWMFGAPLLFEQVDQSPSQGGLGSARGLAGALVALLVPLAAATNWTLLQRDGQRRAAAHGEESGAERPSLLPAVLIGAALSALATLPAALPLRASAHDVSLLALLGVLQLALPCALVVIVARRMPGAQIAMIGLLEILFGVLWAWWGAGEEPAASTLQGGAVVLASLLAAHAIDAMRARRAVARPL